MTLIVTWAVRALCVCGLGVFATGCFITKTVVNANYAELPVENYEVGETTWSDVMTDLGPPAPSTTTESAAKNISLRHLRYAASEERTTSFVIGQYLSFPFVWSERDELSAYLFEFDKEGYLTSIARESNEVRWRPVESGKTVPKNEVEIIKWKN